MEQPLINKKSSIMHKIWHVPMIELTKFSSLVKILLFIQNTVDTSFVYSDLIVFPVKILLTLLS